MRLLVQRYLVFGYVIFDTTSCLVPGTASSKTSMPAQDKWNEYRRTLRRISHRSPAEYALHPHSNRIPSPTNLAAWTCVAIGDRLLSSPLSSTSPREVDTRDGTLIFGLTCRVDLRLERDSTPQLERNKIILTRKRSASRARGG